jgi:glutathione S-transferase
VARAEAATLYVIKGSHSCRAAMLMLGHKQVPYEIVELPSGLHPLGVRLAGFVGDESLERDVDGRSRWPVAIAGRTGTVPALRLDGDRASTSRAIARLLDSRFPEPPLYPTGENERAGVEAAEHFADTELQMTARRLVLAAGANGHLSGGGAGGRLGPLLFARPRARRAATYLFGVIFDAGPGKESRLMGESREMLDRIEGMIADGTLDGPRLNAADMQVAPSVALLAYHPTLREEIANRPAGRMLDRLLPAA